MRNSDNPPSLQNPFDGPDSKKEKLERFIDAGLNQLLEERCQRVNQGNNGVILKLHLEDIPDDLHESLQELGVSLESDQAFKVLKFYSMGSGKHEFDMQMRAYEIISAHHDEPDIAIVPKPHLYRDLSILPTVREKLKNKGVKNIGEKVELLVMDFVPGDDLATIMFREIIRTSPYTRDLLHQLHTFKFEDFENEMSRALGLPEAKNTYRDEADRQSQEKRERILRYQALHFELAKQGFRLHPAIGKQVKRTLELLHENGLSHRDGHHRNFMIVGDPNADAVATPQTYIIDFGSAKEFEGDYRENKEKIYREGWGSGDPNRQTDEDILSSLDRLALGGESLESKAMKKFKQRLAPAREDLLGDRDGRRYVQMLRDSIGGGELDIAKHYNKCPTRPRRPFAFMSALFILHDEKIISLAQMYYFLDSLTSIVSKDDRIEFIRAIKMLEEK